MAKTTTVQHIGYCLAVEHDKHVLLIDLDPQANLTSTFGIAPEDLRLLGCAQRETPLSQIIKNCSDEENLDPALNIELSRAELELMSEINATYLLRSALPPLWKAPRSLKKAPTTISLLIALLL